MIDVSCHTSPSPEWAQKQFGGSRIPDKRLRKRLQVIGKQMALQPGDSIPRLFPQPSAMDACYDFMKHEKITPAQVQFDHWQLTRQAMAQSEMTIALVGDLSTFSWNRSDIIEGLGPVGDRIGATQGFLMHSVLALEIQEKEFNASSARHPARILGLAHQQMHVCPRLSEEQKKTKTQRNRKNGQGNSRANKSDAPLETDLWMDSLGELGPVPEGRKYVVVVDRGGDIYEHLLECRNKGYGHCIRASQDRVLVSENEKLFELARTKPSLGKVKLELRGREGKPARTACLSVSVLRDVEIRSPKRPGHAPGKLPGIGVSVVRVWEENAPNEEERVEWLLLVSGSPETFEEAVYWVRLYALRWVIEEYHKCVKSGMGAEELQLETGKGLMTAISVMAVVALRLLAMRDMARLWPEEPARVSGLDEQELEVLGRSVKRELKTVRDVVLALGRLGGHLNRKSDGLPGWMTLWHGMFRLQMLVAGYRLAKGS